MLKENTYDLVGNTPLIELRHIEKEFNLNCHLYAKDYFLAGLSHMLLFEFEAYLADFLAHRYNLSLLDINYN